MGYKILYTPDGKQHWTSKGKGKLFYRAFVLTAAILLVAALWQGRGHMLSLYLTLEELTLQLEQSSTPVEVFGAFSQAFQEVTGG